MSTLQTLRNKAGLLISIVIGLALLAFILTDLMQSGQSMFSGPVNTVAKINGIEVPIEKYTTMLSNMEENHQRSKGTSIDERTRMSFKQSAWDEIVLDALYEEEFSTLGLGVRSPQHGSMLGVTPEELQDMVLGDNIAPFVKQYFTNPETNEYDKNSARGFLQNMGQNQEQKNAWIEVEKILMTERLRTKYRNLITKGLYVTSKEAELISANKNKSIDIRFISLPFATVKDSVAEVTDDEIADYYKKHKEDYTQEESVDLEYITYKIIPSEKDYEATRNWLKENTDDFRLTENDEQFIRSNSDLPFDSKFYAPGELYPSIDSFAFSDTASVGDVTEIYFENDYYKISKISKIAAIPDSVHARHILLKSKDATVKADSLKLLLENGASFAQLAMENSEGPTAPKGGDLGWFKEGSMVKPFNDTCFFGQKGKIYTVFSQFGVHVVEILEQSAKSEKVQIATLASKVVASTVTRNAIYSQAGKFVNENPTREQFNAALDPAITGDKKISTGIKKSDYSIVGLSNSRQIIKWAFNADVNNVSEVFECDENFVIATLTKHNEKGQADLESVENQIKTEILKEKKGQILSEKIKASGSYNSLDELAQKLDTQVKEAKGINFTNSSIPGLGAESKVIGVASVLETGKISDVLVGDYGVYVISTTNISESSTSTPEIEKRNQAQALSSKFGYNIDKTLKEGADIVDNRILFE